MIHISIIHFRYDWPRPSAGHPASASPNWDCTQSGGPPHGESCPRPAMPTRVSAGPPEDRRFPSAGA